MRVVSFNVNGLRAILERRDCPHRTVKGLLEALGGDIICVQETKLARVGEEERELALVDGWEAFFSCSGRAWSGVATYVRAAAAMPTGAEEGFTACRRGSGGGNGSGSGAGGAPAPHPCLVQHIGLDELAALELRWRDCLRRGKAVLVCGDLNIGPTQLDYAHEGHDMQRRDRRWLHRLMGSGGGGPAASGGAGSPLPAEARGGDGWGGGAAAWAQSNGDASGANGASAEGASFVDAFRAFFPDRRLDLFLVAGLPIGRPPAPPPLLGAAAEAAAAEGSEAATGSASSAQPQHPQLWVSACDIWPEFQGSDHCPVVLDLACEGGAFPCASESPELAARRHLFRDRQLTLHGWLQPRSPGVGAGEGAAPSVGGTPVAGARSPGAAPGMGAAGAAMEADAEPSPLASTAGSQASQAGQQQQGQRGGQPPPAPTQQRQQQQQRQPKPSAGRGAASGGKRQQPSLKSFFLPHQAAPAEQGQGQPVPAVAVTAPAVGPSSQLQASLAPLAPQPQRDQSQQPSQQQQSRQQPLMQAQQAQQQAGGGAPHAQPPPPPPPDAAFLAAELEAAERGRRAKLDADKAAWRGIQARMAVPTCAHGEAVVMKKVNKAGPNKGRFFYTCPRPEGKPPDGRCQFFKWVEKRAGDHPNTLLGQPSGSAAKRHKSDK
eukprot:scaffold24.g2973.t1